MHQVSASRPSWDRALQSFYRGTFFQYTSGLDDEHVMEDTLQRDVPEQTMIRQMRWPG